jgi:MoxR-like ATPase
MPNCRPARLRNKKSRGCGEFPASDKIDFLNERTNMELAVEKFKVENEPYYLPIGREVELFQTAYDAKLPVMLKGPTGCGKTRFVEYMAYQLQRR